MQAESQHQPSLHTLPPEWPHDLLPAIQARLAADRSALVVLDDDPTGTQTVHDVAVLAEWSVGQLQAQLARDEATFYILTNSRSLPAAAAAALSAEIGRNLVLAARQSGRAFVVVSRSDSTLRGHFPGEVEALAAGLNRAFDATLLLPFFKEGGRYTIESVHYVADGEQLIPVGQTEFARDATFGFRASDLRLWVAEKTGGRVAAEAVAAITLADIRGGGPRRVSERLAALGAGQVCVVDAASMRDLHVVVLALLDAEAQGRQFLYRSAASFVQARAGLAPRPLLTADELRLPPGGGLVVVGSHVPTTTRQLRALLERSESVSVELAVATLLDAARADAEIARAAAAVELQLGAGRDVVLYTSRELVVGERSAQLAIGQRISAGLVAVVRALTTRPRYLIAKGGITSSDVATRGLGVRRALVRGQLLPGVPLWELGPESRYPGLSYVVFPGNVGGPDALAELVRLLSAKASP